MTPDEYLQVKHFEAILTPGATVLARWTASGHYWSGQAELVEVHAMSFRIRLLQPVGADFYGGWPAGHQLRIPRLEAWRDWSALNRVEPWGGYPVLPISINDWDAVPQGPSSLVSR